MKPKLFIENLLLMELSPAVNHSKLYQINRALSRLKLVNGYKDIDEIGAAWALFAAAACPYARFDKVAEWLEERFDDEQVNDDKDKPIQYLGFLLSQKEYMKDIEAIGFSPQGLINIVFKSGNNMVLPKKTAKKITSLVHNYTIVPGHIIKAIVESADIKKTEIA